MGDKNPVIDAEEVLEVICARCPDNIECPTGGCAEFVRIYNIIKEDAVPVVRCKDCRFWEREFDNVGHCTYAGINLDHADYGYCSYGEKRYDDD